MRRRGGRPGYAAAADGTALRRCVGLLATALLAVSAGCSGLPGLDGAGKGTVTPAPVPSAEPTTAATARLAPGLSPDGIENASALASAHARVLAEQSYTVVLANTVRYANGTLRTRTRTKLELAADRERYRYAVDAVDHRAAMAPSVTRVQFWGARNRVVRRVRTDATVCYFSNVGSRHEPVPRPDVEPAGRAAIERLFAVTDPTVTSSTRQNGRALYRLQWTGTANPGVAGPRRLVALSAVVDARGFVNWYEATYQLTRDRTTVTIVREIRFTDVGDTVIRRPEWVGTPPTTDGCVPSDRNATG